jgi:alpha-beta hydrolase superfamily lysophospholipase
MSNFFQRHWKFVIGCIILFLIGGLTFSWIVGGELCAPANHAVITPSALAVENVSFPSTSGATIHGWLVTPDEPRGVVILQHGIRGDRTAMVPRAQFLSKAGYAVLLFDFQAHGESLGKNITLGHLESRDSQAAVKYVKSRFPGKPVGVIGVSLGAAAAALADPPLDVQALVLEMMYPTIVEATKDRCEIILGTPGRALSPFLTGQIKLRIGCSTDDLRPIEHVGKITVPKLFLAGTSDHHTKFSEAQNIFRQAAEPKSFVPFEGATHQDLHRFAKVQYENLILNFLEKNLK